MGDSNLSMKLPLRDAQEEFLRILGRLNDEEESKNFMSWIHWNWLNSCTPPNKSELPEDVLKAIADDLRSNLPRDAVLSSENIRPPLIGQNSDCDPDHTLHVDAFLYDEEMLDTLCEEGQLARSYCLQCGSHKTKPMTYISHSASRERLSYMFNNLLQPIDGKVLLDIGSRLGAVLYGAFLYTKAAKIVGIEMNSDFCKLQRGVIKKYGFQERIEIVEDNVINRPDVVQAADIIIMNNVFEFFMEPEHQVAMWGFLRQAIKRGTVMVTIPPLSVTFSSVQTGINLSEWVQELSPFAGDVPPGVPISPEIGDVQQYVIL